MSNEELARILNLQVQKCKEVLEVKQKEYGLEDRLHNFRVAASLTNSTLRAALAGMMAKHTVSIYDMCNSPQRSPLGQWDEKITDHINYLLLLACVVREEMK